MTLTFFFFLFFWRHAFRHQNSHIWNTTVASLEHNCHQSYSTRGEVQRTSDKNFIRHIDCFVKNIKYNSVVKILACLILPSPYSWCVWLCPSNELCCSDHCAVTMEYHGLFPTVWIFFCFDGSPQYVPMRSERLQLVVSGGVGGGGG